MNNLQTCISSQVSISNSALINISNSFEERLIKKNEFFTQTGSLCREMCFVNSGYLRVYNIANGKEITLWIAGPGKFVTSLSSFIFETPNYWNIQAITDVNISVIKRDRHFSLCQEEPKWLEFDNLLLAHSFTLLEKSMFDQLHMDAQQRFDALMQQEPELFNHVPLQYIASMLRMTPESLSRLRKKLTQPTS